jgi:hypothetical protein
MGINRFMDIFRIIIILSTVSLLVGCGGGGGGGSDGNGPTATGPEVNNAPIADAGYDLKVKAGDIVTLDGSLSSDIDNDTLTYKWEQVSGETVVLTNSNRVKAQFKAKEPSEFKLTVTDPKGLSSSDICTVLIIQDAESLTTAQAEEVLYASYAGIGYNKLKSDADDDEALYNVMLDDLNTLTYYFIVDIFGKQFLSNWFVEATKLCVASLAGTAVTYQYATNPKGISSAEVKIDQIKNANISGENFSCDFHAKLTVKFNSDGYTYNNIVYKGKEGSDMDLEAELKGNIKYITDNGKKEIRPSMESVTITAHKSFSASYSGYTVKYREWNIHYGAKDDTINLYLVPMISNIADDYADVRQYSLKGDFDVLKNNDIKPYSYYYDMKYGQLDLRQYAPAFGMYIALSGEVSVPSLYGATVKISSPGFEILDGDYMQLMSVMLNVEKVTPEVFMKWIEDTIAGGVMFSECVNRDDAGLWKTGKIVMTLKSGNPIEAAFDADGSATLSSDGVPIGEPILQWQDKDPLGP